MISPLILLWAALALQDPPPPPADGSTPLPWVEQRPSPLADDSLQIPWTKLPGAQAEGLAGFPELQELFLNPAAKSALKAPALRKPAAGKGAGALPLPALTPAGLPTAGSASLAGANTAALSKLLPVILTQRLSAGAMTEAEVRELVQLLSSPDALLALQAEAAQAAASQASQKLDPELTQLVLGLLKDSDLLKPGMAGEGGSEAAPALKDIVLDVRLVRSWFASLDTDGSSGIDFLEYRDHTMLSLELFQRLDLDRNGMLNFKEFLGPVAVTAERGGLQVNEEMLLWLEAELTRQVEENQPVAATPAQSSTPNPATVILARARAQLGLPEEGVDLGTGPAAVPPQEESSVETPGERATRIALEIYPAGKPVESSTAPAADAAPAVESPAPDESPDR